MHLEESFVGAFVKRSKRERYRDMLSNPRLRRKFTGQLAHFTDLDPKYRLPIPGDRLFAGNIAAELQKRHSPSIVYAISEDPALDQKELPLVEALDQIVGRGMGAILYAFLDGSRSSRRKTNALSLSVMIRWKDENTSDSLSAVKTRTVISSRAFFRQQRRRWSGGTFPDQTPTN